MAVSHDYTFSRNKGIITFIDHDADKSYDFNINTGIMTNATTGRQINSCPAGFGKFLENYHGEDCVVRFMDNARRSPYEYGIPVDNRYCVLRNISHMAYATEFLTVLDKAQSLGATLGTDYTWRVFEVNNLRELNTYFKDFAKYCRETDNPTIADFLDRDGAQYFIQRNHLDKYHLTHEMQMAIYNQRKNIPVEDIPYYAYYLGRGVYDFFEGNISSAFRYIRDFLELCKKMDVKPPKEDFFRSYINFKREYQMRKKEIDAAAIVRNYADKREALTFESEDFMVVIPQTSDDFKAEADAQHNCVFSMYLNRVINGETHVVFIRRKDNPTQSLITCEVRNGEIWQFLEKYNHAPSDPALIAFKTAYQMHLNNLWSE